MFCRLRFCLFLLLSYNSCSSSSSSLLEEENDAYTQIMHRQLIIAYDRSIKDLLLQDQSLIKSHTNLLSSFENDNESLCQYIITQRATKSMIDKYNRRTIKSIIKMMNSTGIIQDKIKSRYSPFIHLSLLRSLILIISTFRQPSFIVPSSSRCLVDLYDVKIIELFVSNLQSYYQTLQIDRQRYHVFTYHATKMTNFEPNELTDDHRNAHEMKEESESHSKDYKMILMLIKVKIQNYIGFDKDSPFRVFDMHHEKIEL